MRFHLSAIAITFALAFGSSAEVSAQQGVPHARPKIGLILSGGGAKGASHVGVIKVLEELGVPIDYIAGTSMGAIVGGLYASGMNANELADAIRSIDWDDIFNDKPKREDRDFRRKLDDEGFLVRYKLGFKDGAFQFPRSAIDGQKLHFALRKLAKRAIGIENFDRLPIPFRAVAADIETGDAVVMGSGDLVNAMRASMAVSGVFPPVEIGGRLLVDGGLANNVPIDVGRRMGADILIVVGFPEQLKKRKDLNSVVSIVLQSLDLLIIQNSRLQLKTLRPEDIYIVPALGDIGAASFDRAADAIAVGESAARAISSKLKALASGQGTMQLSVQPPQQPQPEAITVDFVRIDNRSRLSDDLIKSRLTIKPGDKLDFDQLEHDLADIYGLDYYESVEYQVVMEGDKTGIEVIAKEKSQGLDSIRFGLSLETNFEGDSAYNLSVRYQKEGINELGGELILQAIAGEDLGALVGFLQPLDPATRYYITPSFQYLARDVSTFANGSREAEFRVKTAIFRMILARQLANWGAVSAGLERGWGWSDVEVGTPVQREDDFGIGAFMTRFNYDTFDNLNFPNRGTKAFAEFKRSIGALGADDTFNAVTAEVGNARTWDKNTILVGASTGITFNGTAPTQSLFLLGGFSNLSGFETDELSGQDFALGRVVYYRNIGARPGSFGVPVYLGASLEAGNVWQDRSDMAFNDLLLAGSLFIGLDTPLGPIYLAYGQAEGGRNSAYLFLGQLF